MSEDPLCVSAPLREKTTPNGTQPMHPTACAPLQRLVMVSLARRAPAPTLICVTHPTTTRACLLLAATLLTTACTGPGRGQDDTAPPVPGQIQTSAAPIAATPDPPVGSGPSEQAEDVHPGLLLDAMVGQVNGQPIYARTVIEPIEEQLARLGRDQERATFRERAVELIVGELRRIVTERLVLGDAERELSQQQQQALSNVLQELREQTIREVGGGVPIRADERLRAESGVSLEQMMAETRQGLVIRNYLQRKVDPQIHVSRRDIERYYEEHIDDYVNPGGRVLRVIRVRGDREVAEVEQRLAAGEPFIALAESKLNQFNPEQQGRFAEGPVAGDAVFANEAMNAAMRKLKPGEHSERIDLNRQAHIWIYLEQMLPPEGRSLQEAQLEIDRRLRFLQRQELTQRYHDRLLESGSYDSIEQMAVSLLEVVMTRYARPR